MKLKVLCVHGVGHHPTGGAWEGEWRDAIAAALRSLDGDVEPVIEFVRLDDIFARHPIGPLDVLEAIAKLAGSGLASLFRQPKGIGDNIRWTAGMVVQWVDSSALRRETRQRLDAAMTAFQPDVVCAHSLGSL